MGHVIVCFNCNVIEPFLNERKFCRITSALVQTIREISPFLACCPGTGYCRFVKCVDAVRLYLKFCNSF